MPDVHAKMFSPSGSCKWLNCPGSAALEAQFPDTASEYAAEGTLAHSIAELKLNKKFTVMTQKSFTAQMNKLKKDKYYSPEMQGYTDEYLDYVEEAAMKFQAQPFVTTEKRVSFEDYASGGFGTSDCILIGDNTMYVIDFKYGKGVPVSAENNSQGMLYALGAVKAYDMFYRIKNIVIAIVQPRLSNISEFKISREDLLKWGENTVKPAAEKVLSGTTECRPGWWCDKGFCKARGRCRAQGESFTALEDFRGVLPPLLSNEEIGDILTKAEGLAAWVSALKDYALKSILDGKSIPGWKAVEGRRVRSFTNADKAFEYLVSKKIVQEDMLYERKPLTLTGVEKLIGKKDFEAVLSEYITIKPGNPTLVNESDKREPYKMSNAVSDFSDAANK